MKPKLLIVELWGVGDLVIATPLIQAATERFSVTLLAKPFALDLQPRFWPGVTVIPFDAPWTVFHNKYHIWKWPLAEMLKLRNRIAAEQFAAGASARWDPRDHLLLKLGEINRRLGFPRAGSSRFLTDPLPNRRPPNIAMNIGGCWVPNWAFPCPAERPCRSPKEHLGAG